MEGNPARITVLPGQDGLDDGQSFQLLPDHVRLEGQRLVGQRGSHAPHEVDAVFVLGRVCQRSEYLHAAGPINRRRGARTSRLRILSPRFRVVFLRQKFECYRICGQYIIIYIRYRLSVLDKFMYVCSNVLQSIYNILLYFLYWHPQTKVNRRTCIIMVRKNRNASDSLSHA